MTRQNPSGGGMTGATGNLTPDESDEPFIPGELREVGDAEHQADATALQGRHAPAQSADVGEPAHGMESRPVAGSEDQLPPPDRENRIGGDDVSDHDEHF